MGKKTNWTVTEDQTLCRAWLNASETVLPHGADQKATTFWNVVYHLFHAELDTAVERGHNGLKIRWTRINRDVQKFALIFAQVQTLAAEIKATTKTVAVASAVNEGVVAANAAAAALAATATAVPDANEGVDTDLNSSEQQCIEDAKEQFYKEHETKFLFEACWKLLRYSPKWIQLLANSAGVSVASTGSATHHFLSVDAMPRIDDVASSAPPPTEASGNHAGKRRAAALLESYGRGPIQQLQDVTSTLVDEMKRRNELLEEQNAIALFRLDTDIIEDDDARDYFELLRRRYVKKMRASMHPAPLVHIPATVAGGQISSTLHDETDETLAADDEDKHIVDKDLVGGDIV